MVNLSQEEYEHSINDISTFIGQDSLAGLTTKIIESIQNNSVLTTELRIISSLHPEKLIWVKVNARIIVRTKEKTLFLVNLENITAEKELAESRKREEQLHIDYKKQLSIYQSAESNGVATIRVDSGISLVYASDDFLQIIECSREYAFEHADTILSETLHIDYLPVVHQSIKLLLLEKRERFEREISIFPKNGEMRSVVVYGFFWSSADGIFANIIVRDIAAIKYFKKRLENSEKILKKLF